MTKKKKKEVRKNLVRGINKTYDEAFRRLQYLKIRQLDLLDIWIDGPLKELPPIEEERVIINFDNLTSLSGTNGTKEYLEMYRK